MSTKEQAIEIITNEICDGIRESDAGKMKASGRPFRTLREETTTECDHGWIFQCPSTCCTDTGKGKWSIGGGRAIALNRETGKYQELCSSISGVNFRRTGDINKGYTEKTIFLYFYLSEGAESEYPEAVEELRATLCKLINAHLAISSASVSQCMALV